MVRLKISKRIKQKSIFTRFHSIWWELMLFEACMKAISILYVLDKNIFIQSNRKPQLTVIYTLAPIPSRAQSYWKIFLTIAFWKIIFDCRVSHTLPAKMMVIPLVAFSFLYNTPKFFELHTIVPGDKMSHDNGTDYNATEYTFRAAPFRHNVYYFNIYCMWMNFFCMGLIPFVVLIVLNALTLKVSFC